MFLAQVVFVLLFFTLPAHAFDATCGTLPVIDSKSEESDIPSIVSIRAKIDVAVSYKPAISPHALLVPVTIEQSGNGFVKGGFIITSAHIFVPETLRFSDGVRVYRLPVVSIKNTDISVDGLPAHIEYINRRRDVAVLSLDPSITLSELPFPFVETWIDEHAGTSHLEPGNCLSMVNVGNVPESGLFLSTFAIAEDNFIAQSMSEEVFTTSLKLVYGNSGLPVVGFREGIPVLVGIATATRYPAELYGFVTRIDTLIPIIEALKHRMPHE